MTFGTKRECIYIYIHIWCIMSTKGNVTICLFEILFVTPRINWRPTHSYQQPELWKEKKYTPRGLIGNTEEKKRNRRNRHEEWDRNDNLLHTVAILNEFQRLEPTRTPERPLNCVLCKSAMLLTHLRCKIWNFLFSFRLPSRFGLWAIHIQTLCAVSIKALIACWQEIMETIFIVDFWLFSNLLHITLIEYERILASCPIFFSRSDFCLSRCLVAVVTEPKKGMKKKTNDDGSEL